MTPTFGPGHNPKVAGLFEPKSEQELIDRAWRLAGAPLGELARAQGVEVPDSLRRAKGWVGQLVERALGATAKSLAEPDFRDLGVELKTIPVDRRGHPKESTFVSSIPLGELAQVDWESSRVRKKLARVLFVPVEAEPEIPIAERRLGSPLLWSPSPEEEDRLRADWRTLAGLIAEGYAETLTAHAGECLQVRPKAKDSSARTRYQDADGADELTLPRGFYLRASFTKDLLRRHYSLPPG